MATSWVQVCNLALSILGEKSIASLTEDSKGARACARWYEQARDMVLESHDWKCAMARQALAQLSETPVTDDFSYYYQLPTDPYCLRVVDVPNNASAVYKVEGRKLLSNDDSITIRYVKRVTDPTELDSLVTYAIAVKIAEVTAYSITQSGAIAQAMRVEYGKAWLEAVDANVQGDQNPQVADTSWITEDRA